MADLVESFSNKIVEFVASSKKNDTFDLQSFIPKDMPRYNCDKNFCGEEDEHYLVLGNGNHEIIFLHIDDVKLDCIYLRAIVNQKFKNPLFKTDTAIALESAVRIVSAFWAYKRTTGFRRQSDEFVKDYYDFTHICESILATSEYGCEKTGAIVVNDWDADEPFNTYWWFWFKKLNRLVRWLSKLCFKTFLFDMVWCENGLVTTKHLSHFDSPDWILANTLFPSTTEKRLGIYSDCSEVAWPMVDPLRVQTYRDPTRLNSTFYYICTQRNGLRYATFHSKTGKQELYRIRITVRLSDVDNRALRDLFDATGIRRYDEISDRRIICLLATYRAIQNRSQELFDRILARHVEETLDLVSALNLTQQLTDVVEEEEWGGNEWGKWIVHPFYPAKKRCG